MPDPKPITVARQIVILRIWIRFIRVRGHPWFWRTVSLICSLIYFIAFGVFSAIISANISKAPFCLSSSETPATYMLDYLIQQLWMFSLFFTFFPLDLLAWMTWSFFQLCWITNDFIKRIVSKYHGIFLPSVSFDYFCFYLFKNLGRIKIILVIEEMNEWESKIQVSQFA